MSTIKALHAEMRAMVREELRETRNYLEQSRRHIAIILRDAPLRHGDENALRSITERIQFLDQELEALAKKGLP
jgi:hypothetical protein